MNILILGDSWGVPNYCGPPGVPPKHHTEYLLKDLGHTVYNCAVNGGSNLTTINNARKFLSENQIEINWIFWFHTESLRDRNIIDLDEPFYINDVINKLCLIIYSEFEKLRTDLKAKSIVIGGQAQLLDCFNDIVNADIVIKDWKSIIFNKELPTVHSLCHLDLIERSNDTITDKNELLAKHNILLDLMHQSADFPDNCHPGIRPHKELIKLMWHSR